MILKYKKRKSYYILRALLLLIIAVACKIIFIKTNDRFFNFILHLSSVAFILLILFPHITEFSFWGIKAKGRDIDNTKDVIEEE